MLLYLVTTRPLPAITTMWEHMESRGHNVRKRRQVHARRCQQPVPQHGRRRVHQAHAGEGLHPGGGGRDLAEGGRGRGHRLRRRNALPRRRVPRPSPRGVQQEGSHQRSDQTAADVDRSRTAVRGLPVEPCRAAPFGERSCICEIF